MNKWEPKSGEKKYTASKRVTDYDIPAFGYKSSFFIIIVSFIAVTVVPDVVKQFAPNGKGICVILESLMIGFAVAYRQYFKESKQGKCKGFWITGGLVSLLAAIILFMFYYGSILV